MKQLKLVDSLNGKKQVRRNKAINWYCRQLSKGNELDKYWKREYHTDAQIIQEKCQVR